MLGSNSTVAIPSPHKCPFQCVCVCVFLEFFRLLCGTGKNFLIWIGDQPQIVVTEPELVKEILVNKEGIYKKTKPHDYLKRLLGDGLVVTEGEKWSKLRKLSNFAFHGESLKVNWFFSIVSLCFLQLIYKNIILLYVMLGHGSFNGG